MHKWLCVPLALLLILALLPTAAFADSAFPDVPDGALFPWGDPEVGDPVDPWELDSELIFDGEIEGALEYDGPIPPEARRRTLYILDAQKDFLPCDDWTDDVLFPDEGMEIPQLYQYDFRKIVCFYSGAPKAVATSGCGATSMSMIIAYLTGNMTQDPYTLFRWTVNNNMYGGSGLTHEAITELGIRYGVGGQWMKGDEALIKSALRQGFPIIAHMGPGTFTKRGHYIVLRGLTADGRILVNDPNSAQHSETAFDYAELSRQTRSNRPFMICYRADE